jgi:hypothetical protein
MAAPIESDQDLAHKMARDAYHAGIALRARKRAGGDSDVQQVISVLSKRISQRAAEKIDDRHARQVARTEVYNSVRPVLETLAAHHTRLSSRSRKLVFGLWATLAIVALAAWGLM